MELINGTLNLGYAVIALILLIYTWNTPLHITEVTAISRGILSAAFFLLLFDGIANIFFLDSPIIYGVLLGISFVNYFAILAWYSLYIITVIQVHNSFTRTALVTNLFCCAAGALMWIANCIRPYCFDIITDRVLSVWMSTLALLPTVISILIDLLLLVKYRSRIDHLELFSLTLIPLTFPVSIIFEWLVPGVRIRNALILILILWNHTVIGSKRDRELWKTEQELAEYRYILSLERVKPHYIYNVLSSIYYLCDQDPKEAQRAIKYFSDYLRKSLYTMDDTQTVPFRWEMELIRNYLSLEMMRFRDQFQVEYDTPAVDFELPPFTIQILVENAVKHGVSRRTENDGLIRIITEETPEHIRIIVEDNGSGSSNLSSDQPEDIAKHDPFGLTNVRERLSALSSGTLTIDSNPEGGTRAAVLLPK